MASDHDAFANWLKTLAPEELAKLKAFHSASAQTAADTAVQDDARPCDSSSSLSPRSLLIYQNQEAFYHAQDGCYTGPIPACFDYVPPQDVEDLDGADPAQPSDSADPAQPSQDDGAQPSQPSMPPADEAEAVSEQPIPAGGEYLPMEEPSSSTAFHATPQAGLFSMMGNLIEMPAVITAATHQQPFPLLFFDPEAQSKPINRHELWQLIKRPDLGAVRRTATHQDPAGIEAFPATALGEAAAAEAPPRSPTELEAASTALFARRSQGRTADQSHATGAACSQAQPTPKATAAEPGPSPEPASSSTDLHSQTREGIFFEPEFMASDHKPSYSGTERPPQPFGLALIWDSRTWINFYGGEPPKTAVEIDVETHFYTVEPGPAEDQPSQPEPGQEEEDTESSGAQEDLPPCPPLREWFSADTGVLRYWHFGAAGQANPRQMGKQSVPALCLQDLKSLPEPLVDKRKNIIIDPPSKPYLYKPPAMALPRLPCPNMRNCVIVPSLTLPHTFDLDPAFARMYYMGSRGEMRCGLPCSTVPFCPYHSACGLLGVAVCLRSLHLAFFSLVNMSPSRESHVSPTQERATVVRADKHVLLPLQSVPKTRRPRFPPALSKGGPHQPPGPQPSWRASLLGLSHPDGNSPSVLDSMFRSFCGSSGTRHRSLQEAKYSQQLLAQSIMPFTAGTLETYLSACRQFIEYLILNSLEVSSVSVASLGDLLWACNSSLEEDREVCRAGPKPMIKALSWLAKTAGLAQLAAVLSDRLIRTFTAQADMDRREALPLPLAVVVAWELRICQPECPTELCLLLGGFLLALHGKMPDADSFQVPGPPRDPANGLWVLPFLRAVQTIWERTEEIYGKPAAAYHQPMSYSQALGCLRFFMCRKHLEGNSPELLTPDEASAFTMHSLKVCLLSAGQHPTVGPPFSVISSSREAELEQVSSETQPATADSAETQPVPSTKPSEQRSPAASSLPPTIPADDIEALLVESFAVSQADSSDSEDHATPPTVEDIAIFQNGPWKSVHAQPLGGDKAACGTPRSTAAFSPTCPNTAFFCRRAACRRLLDALP
ncbi:unnamed protein product [Symbiodinium sp. CCMP2592]|nr:unnamed protein product [Symbiodinium sp. CCMP2592]